MTADETATRPRQAKACKANRLKGARTAARVLLDRLDDLEPRDIEALTERLMFECERRGLPVPEL